MSRRAFSSIPERGSSAFPPTFPPNNPPSTVRKTKQRSKSSINATVASLLEYLESTGYSEPLSTRTLQSPSSKVVFSIFEHLVGLPNFKLPSTKQAAEECFLSTLRTLGYKGTLSKSTIATPGAPHAWPHILAAFDWLRKETTEVDKIWQDDDVFIRLDCQLPSEPPVAKLVFEFCMNSLRDQQMRIEADRMEMFDAQLEQAMDYPSAQLQRINEERLELDSEPNMESLDSEERRLTLAIREAEIANAHATEEKEMLSLSLRQAETAAKVVADELRDLKSKKLALQESVDKLEAKLASQNSTHGGLAQTHQILTERLDQRNRARQQLSEEIQSLSIKLARLEATVAPAVDKFNLLSSSLASYPWAPRLDVRPYLSTFDPIKEIPLMCIEVKDALQQLQTLLASVKSAEASGEERLEELKTSLAQKKFELENLRSAVSKSSANRAEFAVKLASMKDAHEQWLKETEAAVKEADRTYQMRRTSKERLEHSIKEYHDGAAYFNDLSEREKELAENLVKDLAEFLNDLQMVATARLWDANARRDAFENLYRDINSAREMFENQAQELFAEIDKDDTEI